MDLSHCGPLQNLVGGSTSSFHASQVAVGTHNDSDVFFDFVWHVVMITSAVVE